MATKTRMPVLGVTQACEILEALGCSDDPVSVGGVEMAVCELIFHEVAQKPSGGEKKASEVRLKYSTGGGRWVSGTLRDMAADRFKDAARLK